MQATSHETTDNRIVWTCFKNNDGELGTRSAWFFAPASDFDWDTLDNFLADVNERRPARVREQTADSVRPSVRCSRGVNVPDALAKSRFYGHRLRQGLSDLFRSLNFHTLWQLRLKVCDIPAGDPG